MLLSPLSHAKRGAVIIGIQRARRLKHSRHGIVTKWQPSIVILLA